MCFTQPYSGLISNMTLLFDEYVIAAAISCGLPACGPKRTLRSAGSLISEIKVSSLHCNFQPELYRNTLR